MDLLFKPKTEPGIEISEVTISIKEEPIQNEDCDIFIDEFTNIIKSETSEEYLYPLIQATLEGNRVKRHPLIECTNICKKKYMTTQHADHTDKHIKVENEDVDVDVEGDDDYNVDDDNEDDEDYYDSVQYVTKKNGKTHQPTECPVCKKRYHKNYIKRHLKTHERKMDSNNDNDNAGASTELQEYVLHKAGGDRVSRHPLLICPICKKRYVKKYMRTHMQTHAANPEGKQVECEVCKQILSAQAVPGHMKIHTGKKPFVCPICGRPFKTPDRLKEHEVIHSDARPFVCTHCNKGFKTKSYLRDHVRIHTGEKPFECQICWMKFGFGPVLHRHMRIHNNDRRFSCTVCNKAFIRKVHLDVHMVKHTKEKNFECTACGVKFGRAGNLRIHLVLGRCKGEPKKTLSNVDELNE